MENKLELKQIAPYLPYKLKILHYGKQKVMNMGMGSSNNWIGINTVYKHLNCDDENYKLILQPLTNITKNDGLWKRLKSDFEDFEIIVAPNTLQDLFFVSGNNFYHEFSLDEFSSIYNKLIEHHFDVFGLIKKGLAIDINTLENEK